MEFSRLRLGVRASRTSRNNSFWLRQELKKCWCLSQITAFSEPDHRLPNRFGPDHRLLMFQTCWELSISDSLISWRWWSESSEGSDLSHLKAVIWVIWRRWSESFEGSDISKLKVVLGMYWSWWSVLSKGGDLSKLNTTRILRLPHVHICPRGVLEFEYPGRLGRFDSGIPNVVLLLSALAGWDSD